MIEPITADMLATLEAARDQLDLEHARRAIDWGFWRELTATASPEHLDRVVELIARELRSYRDFPDEPINVWPL